MIVVITVNHFKLEPNDGKLASPCDKIETTKYPRSVFSVLLLPTY